MASNGAELVVIEGLDGSGKSTTAQQTAACLSATYTSSRISVADSTGLYRYRGGELESHTYSRLIDLEPTTDDGKLGTVVKLGAFTVARKFVDLRGIRSSDLLISVRDPQRVDPAVYAPVYCPTPFSAMAPEKRLAIFDHIARSQYPDAIVQLVTAPSEAQDSLSDRDLECQHESPENMELIAQELPLVLRAFTKLYGTPVREVQGLCASTVEATAQVIEPFLGRALV